MQTKLVEAYSFRQIVNLEDIENDDNPPDPKMFYYCASYQICQEGEYNVDMHILSMNEELEDPYT